MKKSSIIVLSLFLVATSVCGIVACADKNKPDTEQPLTSVTLEKNMEEAGSVSGTENRREETVTITATTNIGYTFVGWYKGAEKISDKET